MVSKAREDLPDPEGPVTTVKLRRGISRSKFLRLCCRAPRIMMLSFTLPIYPREGKNAEQTPIQGRSRVRVLRSKRSSYRAPSLSVCGVGRGWGSSGNQLARKQSTEPHSPLRRLPDAAASRAVGLLAASRRCLPDDPSHSLKASRSDAREARALINKPVAALRVQSAFATTKRTIEGFGGRVWGVSWSSVSMQRGDRRAFEAAASGRRRSGEAGSVDCIRASCSRRQPQARSTAPTPQLHPPDDAANQEEEYSA